MRTSPPSISVVLPAFNEEAVIADVVRRTTRALASAGVSDAEIVVVDDGSTDRTGERAQAAAAEIPVRIVRHRHNRGYGAALRSGFDAATRQAIWLMDADGQFNPADLPLLLDRYRHDTLVAGNRRRRRDPWMRRLNHACFFLVVRGLFGRTVGDVNCAFKLFPRPLGAGLSAEGAVISTELVLRARESGYQIVEVDVPHHPRRSGRATGANWRVVARAFVEVVRLRSGPARRTRLVPPPKP